MQINQINLQDDAYPVYLSEIYNPPKQLFVQGALTPNRAHVAIVGTRSATYYGRRLAYQLGSELARAGIVIVSGLASGIDTEAHMGAVEAGGLTVAIQGRGLAEVYPKHNTGLAEQIVAGGGAIVSEYEPTFPPAPWTFPARNRIIAGLCQGVIVVESGPGGGSMLTVNHAIAAGRVIMAVPGNLDKATSAGCNNLIAEGHMLIRDSTDVLIALGLDNRAIPLARPVLPQSTNETTILKLLKQGTSTTQDLIEQGDFNAADFAQIVSLMEITGKIRNLGAGNWAART